MIDCNKITSVAESALEGSALFVVDCTCSPSNEVELLIDGDNGVSIDDCVALSRKVEAAFDRDEEDFSLTVASAGIGSELKHLRQFRKLTGKSVEVLLRNGTKILATLDDVCEESITLSYDERVAVEGKKRKELVHTVRTFTFDEVKYTKEYLDYK